MKISNQLLIIILGIIFPFGCCNKSIPAKEDVEISTNKSKELSKELYLVLRVPECKSAKEFMGSMIRPLPEKSRLDFESLTKFPPWNLSVQVIGDNNSNKTENMELFYTNIDCFVNKPVSDLLDVFSNQNQKEEILSFIANKDSKSEIAIDIVLENMNGFLVHVKDGIVEQYSWFKQDTQY